MICDWCDDEMDEDDAETCLCGFTFCHVHAAPAFHDCEVEYEDIRRDLPYSGGKPTARSPRPSIGPVYVCCGGLKHTSKCHWRHVATDTIMMLMAAAIMCLSMVGLLAFIFAVLERL